MLMLHLSQLQVCVLMIELITYNDLCLLILLLLRDLYLFVILGGYTRMFKGGGVTFIGDAAHTVCTILFSPLCC